MFNQIEDLGLPVDFVSKTATFIYIQKGNKPHKYIPIEYFAEGIILRPPVSQFIQEKEHLRSK